VLDSVAVVEGAGVEADSMLGEAMRTHRNEGTEVAVSRWMFRAARQSLELVAAPSENPPKVNQTVASGSIAAQPRKPPDFTPTPSH
jgi:hypothetical protein